MEISIVYWGFLLACHNENCWDGIPRAVINLRCAQGPAIGQFGFDRPGSLAMLPWLYGAQVENSVCMPNHFHLVVETSAANLVAGMKWFLGTYTSRFNRRHKFFGHLFSGRHKALVVDSASPGYLKRCAITCI